MAPSSLKPKTTLKHARSSSFPSTSHPIVSQLDAHLSRVKSSSEATASSLSSFTSRLSDLENLLDYTEDVIQLPQVQAISQDKLDELLEGYLKLLDVCATIKDLLSNEKQNQQDLLSALRRRQNMDDISSYQTSRKKSKKMIQKLLKDLKSRMKETVEKPETLAVASMLKEVQSVTLGLFKSLLSYVNGNGSQSSSWSLLSKIINSKKEEVESSNEFDNVDAALCSLLGHNKTSKYEELTSQLREMEATIEVVEEGLECFFRRLIKTRVSLLNVLNHH